MKTIYAILFLSLLSFGTEAKDKKDFSFGTFTGIGFYSIDDPEGETEAKAVTQIIDFFGTYSIGRDSRLFFEFSMIDEDFNASTTETGLTIESTDLTALYQTRLRMSKAFKPWLGAGLMFSQAEYSRRFLVDNNGFLAQSFPNRSVNETALVISLMNETELDWDLADLIYGVSYKKSLDDGRNGISINIGLKF